MADDPRNEDNRDRSLVSGSDDYEVRYFPDENGVSMDEARELIRKHGNDRETLNAEVRSGGPGSYASVALT